MASSPSSAVRFPASGFRSPLPPEAPKESAISRLLIAPLTFLSFLLSLALIDSRNHSLRTHSHSPSRAPRTTVLGHAKAFLHALIYKPTPSSPYAYIKSPNSNSQKNGKGEKDNESEPWHWHTKQRRMMKAEMEDAFRVRKWVVVFLVLFGVVAAAGGVLVVRWACWAWRHWGEDVSEQIRIHSGEASIFYGAIDRARGLGRIW